MTKYAALIRGIGPSDPNMRGAKLAWSFQSMGFTNVRSFLSSGNVLFESDETDRFHLEKMAEAALPGLLGFSRDVFIRSQAELQAIVDANPFGGLKHQNSGKTYLTVTFCKTPPQDLPPLPYQPPGKSFQVLTMVDGAICCVVDLTTGKTTDLMPWLERQFGKRITTRTWATVTRLLGKM